MWTLNRVVTMAIYQVQVKFRHPSPSDDGVWITVSKGLTQLEAKEYLAMWKRSSDEARNIAGIRVMREGREVKL
jgi:hypothetical protein